MSTTTDAKTIEALRDISFQLKRMNKQMGTLNSSIEKYTASNRELVATLSKLYLNRRFGANDSEDSEKTNSQSTYFNTNEYWYGGLE